MATYKGTLKDGNGNILYTATSADKVDGLSTLLSNKQDALVSGTNIKTINNESILGSGNITISGGGDTSSLMPKAGGTFTGSVTLSAQDDALVMPNNAMIKTPIDSSNRTIYGYNASEDTLIVGSPYAKTNIRGENTRPTYNGNNLALSSDVPSGNALWNNGNTQWAHGANVTCKETSSGTSEWSFDCEGTNSGTMWHVWSSKNGSSILACYPYDNHVTVPNGTFTCSSSITGTNIYASSDRRLKENIKTSEIDCTKIIKDIKLKEFNFIKDKDKKIVVGAIAQELKEILPRKYQAELVNEDNEGYLSINEGKLVYIAIGALKEEQAKVKALEERLERLEKLLEK